MSSVHSFAESRVGPDYLIFLVGILIFTIALYILRAPSILPSNIQKQWEFTRESVMVVAQFIFAVFAIIVFSLGRFYPIMSEAITGQRFNVQAPYFNFFAYIGFWTCDLNDPGELHALSEKEYPSLDEKSHNIWSYSSAHDMDFCTLWRSF